MKRLVLLSAALVLALTAPAASAAPKLAGTYGGTAVHPNPLFTGTEASDEPYTTRFSVVVVRRGDAFRVASVYAFVRTVCVAETAIQDIELFKTWTRRGPRVSGGAFTIERKGITIRGQVGDGQATGTMSASAGDGCTVSDVRFSAARRPGS